MKKKNILIVSMSAGFGHIRAGDTLLDYAKENLSQVHAEHIDIFNTNSLFKDYSKFYDVISKKIPIIWSLAYKLSDVKPITFIIKKIARLNIFYSRKTKNDIYQKNPDILIFTIPPPFFSFALKKMHPNVKIGVVITDYYAHKYYQFPFIDYYFVANDEVSKNLEKIGVKKEKIIISGIPVNPRFYIKEDIEKLKSEYSVNNGLSIVLCIASFKISKKDLVFLVRQLLNFNPKINVIFIAAGKKVFYDLISRNFSGDERLSIVNWTNTMEEYIKISDVVISKAGGLTVSECLAIKKPMIIINPIPGQEEHNAEFVERIKMGVRVKNIRNVTKILPKLISSNNKNVTLQKNPSKKIFQVLLK